MTMPRVLAGLGAAVALLGTAPDAGWSGMDEIRLPEVAAKGRMSVEEAIGRRRSVRDYADRPLDLRQIGALCWSAQGLTDKARRLRAAPSAGATYPLVLYVVTKDGVFRYVPERHALTRHRAEDVRLRLQAAALEQEWVGAAPAVFVLAAEMARTVRRYGARAERYVWMEVGHAAQNLLLQAVALGLAGVPVGAFDDEDVAAVLGLSPSERPMYLVPVGYPFR